MKTRITKTLTLIEFLTEQYPDSPRTRIKKLLKNGAISVNDKPVSLHSFLLRPGDKIEIKRQAWTAVRSGFTFPVLYEDDQVMVIDKPPGRPTSSTDGSLSIHKIISESLENMTRKSSGIYFVHRLDKEVSGVLLFAKTRKAMETIKDRWKETGKHYYAFVEGIPEKSEDTIKSWIAEGRYQKVHSAGKGDNARYAVTHYRVIRTIKGNALLDIQTETGQKNQIRVHLSDIGCPIIGDWKYGASDKFSRRIRLHAYSLSFPHPGDGRLITVTSPMPKGFLVLKNKEERYK
ncbi:MAG: RluA family pseudouridine synthase [Bacteroidota bacterium]|nr:RluA family pseudouridine synthase [Bacteroidota bacterium]